MEKPKNWYKPQELTKDAKAYLKFKQKEYWKEKKQEERKEKQPKDFPIRVWAKFRYTGKKPLFIEAFIDGMYLQQAKLENILVDNISKAFNDEIGESVELGSEKISFSDGKMEIRYKSSLTSKWSYMR